MKPEISTIQFLYTKLRDALAAKIASGEWTPGLPIPNEIELARQYNVSPGTVRKALDWMESAKLIVRMQGRGTFVLDPSNPELHNRYERLRMPNGSRVADVVGTAAVIEAVADANECARLRLASGASVRRTKRVRLLNGMPYMLETSVVPAALFPLEGEAAQKDYTLLELAKMSGVLLDKGEERISAENAIAEMAAELACTVGAALLCLDRVLFTIKGKPFEWRVCYCRLAGHYYSASIGPET